MDPSPRAEGLGARAAQRCAALTRPPYSESQHALTRLYLTPAHRATIDRISTWMHAAGMRVRVDPAGTLIGRLEGREPNAPALIIGSHIDSVRDAGAYDGPLGVMLGLACAEALAAEKRTLGFALEVVAFGDEEGSRFQASMNASRAFTGLPAHMTIRDRAGISLGDALDAFGLPHGEFAGAARAPGSVLAFIEPHIEQGPALEAAGAALGVVTAIAGQWRLKVRFTGRAGHAGTTPMRMRRDALAAAAEAVVAIERIAAEGLADLVATVGQISVAPGAPNVIPGAAEFTVDVRAGTNAVRDAGLERMLAAIAGIAERRDIPHEIERVQDLPATAMDGRLRALLGEAALRAGYSAPALVSGAGHDAMVLARFAPTAMLFIRCAGGISHRPDEAVDPDDCEAALAVLLEFIRLLDGG